MGDLIEKLKLDVDVLLGDLKDDADSHAVKEALIEIAGNIKAAIERIKELEANLAAQKRQNLRNVYALMGRSDEYEETP